uniref:Uncharacterized protein n=1 Tax=Bionectria ochroleuca TaxID=29856 RepID=A0A8H7N8G9_BIOOC
MRGDALVLRPLPTNPQRCAPRCRIPKLPNEGIHNCKILSVSHQDSLPLQYGKPIMALSSESLISLIGVLVAIPSAAIVIVSLVKHFLKRPNTDHEYLDVEADVSGLPRVYFRTSTPRLPPRDLRRRQTS